MTADLRDLKIEEIAFVDNGAGKGVKVALFKRYDEETKKMRTLKQVLDELTEEDAAVVLQVIEELKPDEETAEAKQNDEDEDEQAKQEDEDEEETSKKEEEEEETSKRLQKNYAVLKSENQTMKKRMAKMEEDREREAFIKRAEVFPNVPMFSTEELGDFLMQINKKLDHSLAEKTERFIKAVNQICSESSLMGEFGTSGLGTADAGAMSQAETMAKTLMTKDIKLTKAVALNQVWESNPDLRKRYRMEKRGN